MVSLLDVKNKQFNIGEIVTLKSHPLAFQKGGLIDTSINHIPPFMCVKEIHFERKKKEYSAEVAGKQIADNTKYVCVYFNQYKMQFEEKFIYHNMLLKLTKENFTFHNNDYFNSTKVNDSDKSLLEETDGLSEAEYIYGIRVFFKTYKIELRKKIRQHDLKSRNYSSKKANVHTSPAFILSGIKNNEEKSVYNEKDGNPIKITSDKLFKVLWYNSYQEKMSQEYMPKEFFTDDERIYSQSKEDNGEKVNDNKSETEK